MLILVRPLFASTRLPKDCELFRECKLLKRLLLEQTLFGRTLEGARL
jgi:hypothetical protein